MIVVMNHNASKEQVQSVLKRLDKEGFQVHISEGESRTIIGVIGQNTKEILPKLAIQALPGVEKVVPILQPFKLAGREMKPDDSVFQVGNIVIGANDVQVAAGPCAVESREQILEAAWAAKQSGANILRGGAYKPRTSPYSFQGLEEEGLKLLAEAKEETGLAIITEATDTSNLKIVAEYADIVQIGARNMQNFHLLKEAGKLNKPIMLKRGGNATIEEWLLAAEYIMSSGNNQVILCERGIRTFEVATRNTFDLSCIPLLKHLTHLPVFADPSHGTGNWKLVPAMARAAVAAGADGLMVEIHPCPSEALSDGPQSLTPENFSIMMEDIKKIANVLGRSVGNSSD
ncbi:MAG: 3-deoxy-7-phosphoheptulonate synthase [Zhaonellaceae bacterium]|jgi:3-deoxy-7-phosphoheptulonate synthase|nr:3-deoxy-7-phosphoheptulonate synthase [Clostridia bacterium]